MCFSRGRYDRQALGDITLQLDGGPASQGNGCVASDQENRIDIEANSTLPETFKDFDKVSATGHVRVFARTLSLSICR